MAESKSRLPAIAIALAIVAAGMLSAAIVMRSREVQAPDAAPADARAPVEAAVDAAQTVTAEAPDAETRAILPDAAPCVPCQGCRATTCKCSDGTLVSSYHCRNGCCLSASETCDTVCASRNGVAPP